MSLSDEEKGVIKERAKLLIRKLSGDERHKERPYIGIAVFVKTLDGHYVMSRKEKLGETAWSIPGGTVKHGETLQEACIREVLSETGVRIFGLGLLPSPSLAYTYPNGEHHIILFFVASVFLADEKEIAERNYEIKWFTKNDFPENLLEPLPTAIKHLNITSVLL